MTYYTNSLIMNLMEDVPHDEPVILVSGAGQIAIAVWDNGKWRYGPRPGQYWDADYPKAWVKVHACQWDTKARTP